jgi:hypothetical protein
MDTSVTIIGLVITLVIAIPLYFTMRSQRADNKKLKKIFSEFSQGNAYKFELLDKHNQKYLAADKAKKALLVIDFGILTIHTHFADLTDAESCQMVETKYRGSAEITRIEFEISFNNIARRPEIIPFYDSDENHLHTIYAYEEAQCAAKWEKLITKYIN